MHPQQVMIIGPGPSSGKTIVSAGLCRALADAGVRVVPFKAISIIKDRDLQGPSLPPHAYGIVHHLRAARLPYSCAMNPVALMPTSATHGDLYVDGEIIGQAEFITEDTVLLTTLPDEVQAHIWNRIAAAYQEVAAEAEVIVIEGAGSPIDLSVDEDLPNIAVARMVNAPIIVSAQFSRGGAGGAIIGTFRCLPEDIRTLVAGYVLGDVRNPAVTAAVRAYIAEHSGLQLLGIVPHLMLWDGPPNTYPTDEQVYGVWAETLKHGLNAASVGLYQLTA